MTKAQEVRSRRLSIRQKKEKEKEKLLTEEVEQIFAWILKLMDQETQSGEDDVTLVFSKNNQDKNSLWYHTWYAPYYRRYDLSEILQYFNKKQIFTELKKVIEKEEGFRATVKYEVVMGDYVKEFSATTLTIVIE